MKAATHSRWWRRSRNVKMSDCHSWFGAARSNRLGPCSFSGGGGRASSSPSSCRMRRTWLSETPSASNRLSMSLMRRVPSSGCSRLSAATASRFGSAAFGLGGGEGAFGISASGPPAWYVRHQPLIVATPTPNTRATSVAFAPCSRTSFTTLSRSVTGSHRPFTFGCPLNPPLPVRDPPPRVVSSLAIRLSWELTVSARSRDGC